MQTLSSPCSIAQHITFCTGMMRDYDTLAPFHYLSGPPRCVTRIIVARYKDPATLSDPQLAAIAVEALPSLVCSLRRIALPRRYDALNQSLAAALLNREMRTISRIIVHPQFRSIGLATRLIKHLLATAQTPYTEALATMGHIHPLFERAGMTPYHRPPNSAAIRLLAALDAEHLTPADLPTLQLPQLSPFLKTELRRFTRHRFPTTTATLTQAHHHLTSYPIYYLWQAP